MRITVVGSGYVGLVSGVCLAARGHDVTCVDLRKDVVARLNVAVPHIYERGLAELLKSVLASARFRATTDLHAAIETAEIALVAVGTPSENGAIDLGAVRQCVRQIGSCLATTPHHLSLIVKSTVIPGTTDTLVREELEHSSGKKFGAFGLGMNPEFLREGEAIEDFMGPDRIVLGHEDERTLARLEELYAPWNCDKVRVNTRTAEMIKYANNAILTTQISMVNEIANLCAAVGGIDVLDVMHGVHLDKRWSPITRLGRLAPEILTYLIPGCGFGGSCFSKDVQALRAQGESLGLPMNMLNAVLDVNVAQPGQVVSALEQKLGVLSGRRTLVLGLSFKPNTDDVRESASIKIVRDLLGAEADVRCYDPLATENFKLAIGIAADRIQFSSDWRREVEWAEIVIIVNRAQEYCELASLRVAGKTVFDARRLIDPAAVPSADYLSIGRRLS
ncbi:UDP-glucose/GDP-mannose dehydrogenase family protein [Bradyrhizobium sp. ISRA443]|uniref:UDP-glucose dehydrogenase family protein n=1 Tax=unclassified Bradyrhizobium TaxID=2631580 RepID=UPI002479C5E0|nr:MULTISPECIES: UDP-glucose/GDP-mannose dehydrogenase family protein [unclassified Bradyrhizobium]WGR96237.1 UDP-glucose/GDP-mannose dehydrogenase family protein [Bradyrhizobium sp. ISRA435]WGR97907.1 UDP-glucose/GDP-mannose dehydrogenase family protein [Bradyrhizobium sp. ISRA436]WGS04797.1 UDP-glucose/GDP-mannose dehydrogenase family protein [Bradyrhizobium sp. ISRA437]WGS11678.1 UDP-glucose/GDP-mannose dehydrogenase family protein [Bradyrhizobium sp. ISRA443]